MAARMAEAPVVVTWAGLAEEIERQEREDNAKGPEPEAARYVLSRGWWRQALPTVPSLPAGYVTAASTRTGQGGDELRARHLVTASMVRWGWGR